MIRLIGPLLVIAVVVFSLVDCIQTKDEKVPNLPKLVWIALIVLAPPFGAIAWLVVTRFLNRPARPRPPGPRGPDDDPDFLRGLG